MGFITFIGDGLDKWYNLSWKERFLVLLIIGGVICIILRLANVIEMFDNRESFMTMGRGPRKGPPKVPFNAKRTDIEVKINIDMLKSTNKMVSYVTSDKDALPKKQKVHVIFINKKTGQALEAGGSASKKNPKAYTYDSNSNKMWTFNPDSGSLARYDDDDSCVIAGIDDSNEYNGILALHKWSGATNGRNVRFMRWKYDINTGLITSNHFDNYRIKQGDNPKRFNPNDKDPHNVYLAEATPSSPIDSSEQWYALVYKMD